MAASMLAPGSEVTMRPNSALSQSGGKASRVKKRAEVAALAPAGVEKRGGGLSSGFGVTGMFSADGGGPLV